MEELNNLVVRARNGDVQAYGEIVGRFQDMAYGYAYSVLGNLHWAEDAAQEAFIEAYRRLDQLREPAAFPGWFRRIVFKYCDRLTRGVHPMMVPLEGALGLSGDEPDPAEVVIRQEDADRVLQAVCELPEAERIVTTLYYIDGYSQSEIAGFLSVTEITVKNRLRASRRRLRERMMGLVADTLRSRALTEAFTRETVAKLAQVAREFDRSWLRDPLQTDTEDLVEAMTGLGERTAAEATVQATTIDAVHAAFGVYARLGDRPEALEGALDLLTGYMQRTLAPEEEAWARWNVVNALGGLALAGRRGFQEACEAHSQLVDWARRTLPGDDLLWVIHAPLHQHCWVRAGREQEWWALYHRSMQETLPRRQNRWWRLQCLATAGHRLAAALRDAESGEVADAIESVADEDPAWPEAFWARVTALIVRMHTALRLQSLETLGRLADEALSLAERYGAAPPTPPQDERVRWRDVQGLGVYGGVWDLQGHQNPADPDVALTMAYHWIGTVLYAAGSYVRALDCFDRSLARGNTSPHIFLCYAASVWALTHDRRRVLALLRRSRRAVSRLPGALERCREFTDVVDDPEFVAAVSSEGAGPPEDLGSAWAWGLTTYLPADPGLPGKENT